MKTILAILLFSAIVAPAQTNFFPKLLNAQGEVVMTNAEFSSLVGSRVIFKMRDSSTRKAFEVTDLHADALSALKIDSGAALQNQRAMESAKAKAAETYRQQSVIAAKVTAARAAEDEKRYAEKQKQAAIETKRREEEAHQNALRQLAIEDKKASIANKKASTKYFYGTERK